MQYCEVRVKEKAWSRNRVGVVVRVKDLFSFILRTKQNE